MRTLVRMQSVAGWNDNCVFKITSKTQHKSSNVRLSVNVDISRHCKNCILDLNHVHLRAMKNANERL